MKIILDREIGGSKEVDIRGILGGKRYEDNRIIQEYLAG